MTSTPPPLQTPTVSASDTPPTCWQQTQNTQDDSSAAGSEEDADKVLEEGADEDSETETTDGLTVVPNPTFSALYDDANKWTHPTLGRLVVYGVRCGYCSGHFCLAS